MSIDGNVGVGTTAPAAKLDVVTSAGLGVALGVDFAAQEMAIRFKRGGIYLGDVYKAQGQRITFASYGTPYGPAGFRLTGGDVVVPDGRLGIGTESPEVPLHVVGTIKATGDVYGVNLRGQAAGVDGHAYVAGRLGVGTLSPQVALQVGDGFDLENDGRIRMVARDGSGARTWELGTHASWGVRFAIRDLNAGQTRLQIDTDGTVETFGQVKATGGLVSGDIFLNGPSSGGLVGRISAREFYASNGAKIADGSGCYYAPATGL